MKLKEFKTKSGEIILFNGSPNLEMLENLALGAGDIWHSSFEQGYKNSFQELAHQTAIFFWYINDFDNLDQCISWRVNPNHFAVRKTVWDIVNGFDKDFENIQMQALDFGFQTLRFFGGVPLYIKGLFETNHFEQIKISRKDKYAFYIKNFKIRHTVFMLYRLGFWKIWEVKSFLEAKKKYKKRNFNKIIPTRGLVEISEVSVSYIIPTMFRQDFTLQLLDDLALQNLKPTQVIVVDATPESERNESLYSLKQYPFELNVIWQTSKGSCRARNEAIEISKGEYIVFGDDDIRIPNDFIENHIKFLKTYQSDACNGLDIRADIHTQDLNDLKYKLDNFGEFRFKTGVACSFSNANSCVKRDFVNMLGGNDVNFDGGYGEDGDFGLSLAKIGVTVMFNPFSTNLHLKPPSGGYRWWGSQASLLGKKRKQQPWELDSPVRSIKPVPSPTVMYGILKQFTPQQLEEYKHKHFSYYLFKGSKIGFLYRFLRIPYKNLQFKKSIFYAENLMKLGVRNK